MVFKNFKRDLGRFKQSARGFLNKLPENIQKGQNFLNNAVRGAHTAHRLVQHTAGAVSENPMFGAKGKDIAEKASAFSSAGLKKLSEVHGNLNQFSDKMRSFNPQVQVAA